MPSLGLVLVERLVAVVVWADGRHHLLVAGLGCSVGGGGEQGAGDVQAKEQAGQGNY
jgi:hypothetical protein